MKETQDEKTNRESERKNLKKKLEENETKCIRKNE